MKKAMEGALALLAGALAVAVCVGVFFACLLIVKWVGGGIGNWWNSATSVSPEQQARWDKEAEEYKSSPLNPENIAKHCMEQGGVPITSAWDGRVKECKGSGDKNVNIEVNQ